MDHILVLVDNKSELLFGSFVKIENNIVHFKLLDRETKTDFREWKSKNRDISLTARPIEIIKDDRDIPRYIKLETGSVEHTIDIDNLSTEDQIYILLLSMHHFENGVIRIPLGSLHYRSRERALSDPTLIILDKVLEIDEDRFTGRVTIRLDRSLHLNLGDGSRLSISVSNPPPPPNEITYNFLFYKSSEEWTFSDYRRTIFLIDNKPLVFPEGKMIYFNDVVRSGVTEFIDFEIEASLLDRILDAASFEFRVGINEYTLSKEELNIFKRFRNELVEHLNEK